MKNHGLAGLSKTALASASVIAIALSTPAFAEDAAADGEKAANDIIVTAQFREQRLQDTPIAITAISGAELENRALDSVADIASSAPNVNISKGSSAYGSGVAVYIRGIGQYDTNFALEPGVGMYVDDVYHGVMVGSTFDLLDLDRVEILRGPQGTLAGKNSIGGAVKLYSRKPTGSGEGYLQATGGSFDRLELRGAFDMALGKDLFFRLSGFSKRRDGHVKRLDFACDKPAEAGTIPVISTDDSCQIGTLGAIKAWGLRGALRWVPSDKIEVNLIATMVRDDSEAAGAELTYASNATTYGGVPLDSRFIPDRPYISYATFTDPATGWNIDPLATTHAQSVSGQVDWNITDHLKLTSITAYEDMDSVWTIDNDMSPIRVGNTYNHSPYHQFTQELRLNGELSDGIVEYTVGGFWFDGSGRVAGRVLSGAALNFIQNDPVDSQSRSAFAHVIVHPMPEMSIIGGIRYTDDKKSYTFYRANPAGGPAAIVGSLSGVTESYSGNAVDYRLGFDYRFNDALMAYAQFSTGYKGGGINPRPFIPSQVVPFSPERVDAFEVGFKSDLLENALRVNVSAFINKYHDVILIDANGFPGAPGDPGYFPLSAAPFNAGDADIKGVELETTLRPVNGLTIGGSLSYLDFKYTRLDANAASSGIGTGFVPPFTPKWKWSLNAAYEIGLSSGATITPTVSVDYMDSVFTDPVNAATNFLPSNTTVDANITYASPDEKWNLVLGVTNLTDKHYYTNAFDIAGITGTVIKNVARPREWYLSVRRNF